MSIQRELGDVPMPYNKYHEETPIPDSYSRMLDHEVSEWEQPYGYHTKEVEPEAFERKEHSSRKKKY